MGLMLISLSAFYYVRSKIPLPSRQTLNEFFSDDLDFRSDILLDLNQINTICNNYRKKENISQTEYIKAVIAVDAVSFDKMLKIDKSGIVSGTINDETINLLQLKQLEKDFSEF